MSDLRLLRATVDAIDENYEAVMAAMERGPLLVSDIRVEGEDRPIGYWREVTTNVISSRCGCRWGATYDEAPGGSPTFLCEAHRATG